MSGDFQSLIDKRLHELIGRCKTESLREAMSYSLFAGGKRLRPKLLLAVCESVSGGYSDTALNFACAVEMIHTYSLIHDDLPAMDNDDLRRGKPTSHIKFGEAMAILAGDALLHHAFEVMAGENANKAMLAIAKASGANGMVAGQVADIAWENKKADAETLRYIHSLKTGALITACFEAGAILGGASAEAAAVYRSIGEKTGLAFQIRDDILDVTATESEIGKPPGSDEKNNKNTYVTVFGLEKARAEYSSIANRIKEEINKMEHKTDSLKEIILKLTEK